MHIQELRSGNSAGDHPNVGAFFMKARFYWSSSLLFLAFSFSAHAGNALKSEYSKSAVQPVKVDRVANDRIRITYRIPPETMWYSGGVNYLAESGVLRIAIDKCPYNKSCKPMAAGLSNHNDFWAGDATLPYRGEKVLMVYSDEEEQIYP